MPEGDTVHAAARRVDSALAGITLERAELRVPRFAGVDLRGRVVERARARGKHLLIDVGPDAEGRDPVTLHVHLKMEGRIHVHRRGERWRFPGHTARLVLAGDGVEVVGTELGLLRALSPREAEAAVAHLGPDLLGEDWDPEEAVRRLEARPDRTIGEALLDQWVLAGVGNVYRCELCFLRGVDPRDPVSSVRDPRGMVDLAHRLLVANRERVARVTTGDTRRGRKLWVYGLEGRPCARCGRPIERYRLGGEAASGDSEPAESLDRVCYSCPGCQPRTVAES